jgi:transposase-like protein
MKKSSSVKQLFVKPEEALKAAFSVDLKDLDLKQVVSMGLEEFTYQAGMLLINQVMQAEANQLAGPRYSRSPERENYHWGTESGFVYVDGQKTDVKRPRVVTKGKKNGKAHEEVELTSYRAFSDPSAMNKSVMAKLIAGVSTRDYESTVEEVVKGHGISKSAISRRQIQVTAKMLEEFYARRFDDREFVVIMIDGVGAGDVMNVVALGIDVWGKKSVLGIRQGATENHTICAELLSDLIERGLDPKGKYLFILDGSKALEKAVKKTFGSKTLIQRCQLHKRRNVAEHLPKEHHARIDKKLAAAYGMNSAADARKALEAIFDELMRISEPAAGSLAEGMEDTLTVHNLGLKGELKRILSSTNSIESLFSMSRRYKRNVKRWKNFKHVERTLVCTFIEAEKRFRRVQGYRDLKELKKKIENYDATTCNTVAA